MSWIKLKQLQKQTDSKLSCHFVDNCFCDPGHLQATYTWQVCYLKLSITVLVCFLFCFVLFLFFYINKLCQLFAIFKHHLRQQLFRLILAALEISRQIQTCSYAFSAVWWTWLYVKWRALDKLISVSYTFL